MHHLLGSFLSFFKIYFHKIMYQRKKFLIAMSLLCLPLILLSASIFVFHQAYFEDFESHFYDFGMAEVIISTPHEINLEQSKQYAQNSYQNLYKGYAFSIIGQVTSNVSIQNIENEMDQVTYSYDGSSRIFIYEQYFSEPELLNQTRGFRHNEILSDFYGRKPENVSEMVAFLTVNNSENVAQILQHARVIVQNGSYSINYTIVGYQLLNYNPSCPMYIQLYSHIDKINTDRILKFAPNSTKRLWIYCDHQKIDIVNPTTLVQQTITFRSSLERNFYTYYASDDVLTVINFSLNENFTTSEEYYTQYGKYLLIAITVLIPLVFISLLILRRSAYFFFKIQESFWYNSQVFWSIPKIKKELLFEVLINELILFVLSSISGILVGILITGQIAVYVQWSYFSTLLLLNFIILVFFFFDVSKYISRRSEGRKFLRGDIEKFPVKSKKSRQKRIGITLFTLSLLPWLSFYIDNQLSIQYQVPLLEFIKLVLDPLNEYIIEPFYGLFLVVSLLLLVPKLGGSFIKWIMRFAPSLQQGKYRTSLEKWVDHNRQNITTFVIIVSLGFSFISFSTFYHNNQIDQALTKQYINVGADFKYIDYHI